MRRYSLLAATVTLCACTVQKTESSVAKDSVAATVPLPAPAGAEIAPPVSPPGSATVKDSGNAHKTPTAGGERDSAVQAVFEIGPDGKLRRVKR